MFLSYASQDREVAQRLSASLRAAGVEVWFDADGGLQHGDEWDTKIRQQIRNCVLFIPLISRHTQQRLEGYFRLEWELASQRAMTIASGVPFILPILLDDTPEPAAIVPDRFRTVQWLRLNGPDVPPEVQRRLVQLWADRLGRAAGDPSKSADLPPTGPSTSSTVQRSPAPSRKPVWALLVPGALIAAGLVWWLVRNPRTAVSAVPSPPSAAPTSPTSGSAPVSEARQLVRNAHRIFMGLESNRDDFALAEEDCQRALKLDPDDAEVWATYSQLDAAFGYRGFDTSAPRRDQSRSMAERAIRLAPDSPESKLAQAGVWSSYGVNRPETEKLLREILQVRPDDQEALRFLALIVLKRNDLAGCLALNERSAALPGGDPLALYDNARYLWDRNRSAEAYAMLQRSLAQRPFSASIVFETVLEISWRADLAKAAALLTQIPASARLEDRANYITGLVHYFQRDGAAALEAWSSFPRDFYNDFLYDGPKGLLIGLADRLDHRDAAAKIEWKLALDLVDKRIAATPNVGALHYYRAYLLACLGDRAAATEAERTSEQLIGFRLLPGEPLPIGISTLYAELGRFDEILSHPPRTTLGRVILDPRFDGLRTDPRYLRLVEEHRRQLADAKSNLRR